jgi:hypothetical protein
MASISFGKFPVHIKNFRQLTKMPLSARRFRGVVVDSPSEADTYETRLRDGDLVIAYVQNFLFTTFAFTDLPFSQTDGLSDNVFPTEVIAICSLAVRSGGSEDEQVQAMADRIVEYARQCMMNGRRVSPFESKFSSFASFQYNNLHYRRSRKGGDVLQRRGKFTVFASNTTRSYFFAFY